MCGVLRKPSSACVPHFPTACVGQDVWELRVIPEKKTKNVSSAPGGTVGQVTLSTLLTHCSTTHTFQGANHNTAAAAPTTSSPSPFCPALTHSSVSISCTSKSGHSWAWQGPTLTFYPLPAIVPNRHLQMILDSYVLKTVLYWPSTGTFLSANLNVPAFQ